MFLQSFGQQIRRARIARALTQAQLAAAAGITRATLNRLENSGPSDLGIKKVQAILDVLGLTLSITPAAKTRQKDFLRMACAAANVSFKEELTKQALMHALSTGKVTAKWRPHFRYLLDEAEPQLFEGLIRQIGQWTKPGKVENNVAKIAEAVGSLRKTVK